MKVTTRVLLGLLSLFFIVRFCELVLDNAVNLPIWDDFDSVLLFMNRFQDTNTWAEKFALILEQHNEHRIVVNRLFTLLSYQLFSAVNFSFLIYCAAAFLLGTTLSLAIGGVSPMVSITITCAIMLQPQYGDGLNWVTTCLASFSLCLMAILSAHLAFARNRAHLWIYPLLLVAGFTQGNGIILPFCIAIALLLRKNWWRAIATILFGLIIIGLYFQNYRSPNQSQTISALLANYANVLEYGFTLVGASLGFSDPQASISFGVLLTSLFLVILCSPLRLRYPAIIAFLLFLFFSAGLNTAARGLSSAHYALSPGRYTILSSGIIAGILVIGVDYFKSKYLQALLVTLVIAFNFYSYHRYEDSVAQLRIKAINDLSLYLLFGQGLTYPWPERGVPIFEESLHKNLFSLTDVLANLHLADQILPPEGVFPVAKKPLRTHIDRVQSGNDFIVIEGWGFFRHCKSASTQTYIRLFTDSSEIVIRPLQKIRGDLDALFHNKDRQKSGFITMFSKTLLRDERPYALEILYQCKGLTARQRTSYQIERESITKPQTTATIP